MATVTGYALRLPNSIMEEVKLAAEGDATSINQFIVVAVARRLAELRRDAELKAERETQAENTNEYFAVRASRADRGAARAVLALAGSANPMPPREGDEIPEGWLAG